MTTQTMNGWEIHPGCLTQTIGKARITVVLEDEQKYQQSIKPILDMIQDGETRGHAAGRQLPVCAGSILTVRITIGGENMAVRLGPDDGFPGETTLGDIARTASPHELARTALQMSRAALHEPE